MTQSINDLLSNKNFQEPPELKLIRDFVNEQIGIMPRLKITPEAYVIIMPSAAAAGSLRAHLFKLQEHPDIKKRLLVRIG